MCTKNLSQFKRRYLDEAEPSMRPPHTSFFHNSQRQHQHNQRQRDDPQSNSARQISKARQRSGSWHDERLCTCGVIERLRKTRRAERVNYFLVSLDVKLSNVFSGKRIHTHMASTASSTASSSTPTPNPL